MLRSVYAAALLWLLPAAYGRVVVNAATTILIDAREPAPLQKAAADLADDFQRVFGQRAKVVHSPGAPALPSSGSRWRALTQQSSPFGLGAAPHPDRGQSGSGSPPALA